jgi:cysteine desulfurase/selenocysteine lyase
MTAASPRNVRGAAPTLASPVSEEGLERGFDPRRVRQEFPIFDNNPGLVFLDSGASAQKPASVIDRVADYYRTDYANVHRGIYRLSARSTELFEDARVKVQLFLNAADPGEIVFVRGATEAINLVAQSWGASFLEAGDEVIISELEHHSNIVPWQLLRDRIGIRIVVTPIDATGGLDLAAFAARLSPHTRLVAVTHLANATGALVPIETIVELAHRAGARVLVDGCQAAPRLPVDVQALGCDFYAFSGHKTYGPTGIGVLWGRRELLATMPPWQGGGEMIFNVTFEKTTYQDPPHRFEAGTPDISGAIGLATALDFIEGLGRDNILEHEESLTGYGVDRLSRIPDLQLVGAGQRRLGILSFDLKGIHPHDVATVLDRHHVAVRAGHHCAQPLLDKLGLGATTRASLGVYNDERDIDALANAIEAAREMFR